ncbi:MAG: 3-dehydroquinate synthase, partial [Muribaculaceae bacterium]|nr:3-dehydroquinate synthase [Muribaculaceae bacterium]
MSQELIFTNHPGEAIDKLVSGLKPNAVYVIVDTNTHREVLPLLSAMSAAVRSAQVISCDAGDVNKGLDALSEIWRQLNTQGATRSSLIVNVGGGMITDMGGFAA